MNWIIPLLFIVFLLVLYLILTKKPKTTTLSKNLKTSPPTQQCTGPIQFPITPYQTASGTTVSLVHIPILQPSYYSTTSPGTYYQNPEWYEGCFGDNLILQTYNLDSNFMNPNPSSNQIGKQLTDWVNYYKNYLDDTWFQITSQGNSNGVIFNCSKHSTGCKSASSMTAPVSSVSPPCFECRIQAVPSNISTGWIGTRWGMPVLSEENLSTCSPGNYISINSNNTTCVNCPVGTYQNLSDQTACVNCPTGTYQRTTGQTSCVNCPTGTSSNPGSLFCTPCAAGTFSTGTICKTCAPGTISFSNSSSCTPCAAGTYSFQNTCINCSSGLGSLSGSTSCTPCAAGTFASNGICTSCPAGTYQGSSGQSICNSCPLGSTSLIGSTSCNIPACPPVSYCSTVTHFNGSANITIINNLPNIDVWASIADVPKNSSACLQIPFSNTIIMTYQTSQGVFNVGSFYVDGGGYITNIINDSKSLFWSITSCGNTVVLSY
jgi:hypothetical protein